MALAGTRVKGSKTGGLYTVTFTVVASGTYPTGGDSLDFAPIARYTNRQPDLVLVTGIAGFIYQYDHTNKKLFVYCNTAGGADAPLGQHSAGAYAAGVTGDTIKAVCFWMATPGLTN